MKIRALSVGENAALRMGRLVAVEAMPYFAHALFGVRAVAAEGLGTFAVDRRWRLYVDPDLLVGVGRWSPVLIGGVLLHEVGHLLREHAERADALPQPIRHTAWNYAADAEINDDLLAAGISLPAGVITPASLGCQDGGVAEDYYVDSLDVPEDDDPGCGSGAGTGALPGELAESESADMPTGLDRSRADLTRRLVAKDIVAYAANQGPGRGSTPASLKRWASEVLAPPSVRWERVLTATVRRSVGERAGRVNYSYRRPSRRRIPGVLLPGMRAPSVSVAAVVDTSGSMSAADLAAALSEIGGVVKSVGVQRDRFVVLSCDAVATIPTRVKDPRRIELVGGGGTDMRIGIDAVLRIRPRPDVVVVLTDGDTPWPDEPIPTELICVIIGDNTETKRGPAWARTVFVPTGAAA